jgi:dihydropteroate synthase
VPDFVSTGWPVLMAMSNKEFVGEILGVELEDRLTGTVAVTALAAEAGAQVFRVHEVRQTRHALEMIASIMGSRPLSGNGRWIA